MIGNLISNLIGNLIGNLGKSVKKFLNLVKIGHYMKT